MYVCGVHSYPIQTRCDDGSCKSTVVSCRIIFHIVCNVHRAYMYFLCNAIFHSIHFVLHFMQFYSISEANIWTHTIYNYMLFKYMQTNATKRHGMMKKTHAVAVTLKFVFFRFCVPTLNVEIGALARARTATHRVN